VNKKNLSILFGLASFIFLTEVFASEAVNTTMPEDDLNDCGEDFSCFVSAAESCSKAMVNHMTERVISDVLQKTDNNYELKKLPDGKCSLSLAIDSVKLNYTSQLADSLKKRGITQEQIDKELQRQQAKYNVFSGNKGICSGETNDILAMLRKWQRGSFSISDWDNLECSGSYFVQMKVREKGCIKGTHYLDKECVSNDLINVLNDCSKTRQCSETCVNCKKGTYACISSSEAFKNNKCMECFSKFQCNSGYKCKKYQCVKEKK